MTRWFSHLQSNVESSEEGRLERIVDGRHKGMRGWLRFTIIYGSIAFALWVVLLVVANFFLL